MFHTRFTLLYLILKICSMDFGILNLIGGTLRWIYGSIWRTVFHKKKFKYKEYLYGPESTDDWFDETGHDFVNKIVALLAIVLLVTLTTK
jgi:hypothetical protein